VGKLLQKYDVVITTFQTLASEHGAKITTRTLTDDDSDQVSSDSDSAPSKPKKKVATKKTACPLFDVKWLRIVIGMSALDSVLLTHVQ
jgi:hypothetical protein